MEAVIPSEARKLACLLVQSEISRFARNDIVKGLSTTCQRLQPLTKETLVASSFPGFTAESFAFFQELSQHNNKGWFDQNRARYERHAGGADVPHSGMSEL